MSELQATGGYEPNDPVVMSREEYAAALERAKGDGMSEQDKRAEDVWQKLVVLSMADAVVPSLDVVSTGIIAAALAQARREGYLDGIHAARDVCERGEEESR